MHPLTWDAYRSCELTALHSLLWCKSFKEQLWSSSVYIWAYVEEFTAALAQCWTRRHMRPCSLKAGEVFLWAVGAAVAVSPTGWWHCVTSLSRSPKRSGGTSRNPPIICRRKGGVERMQLGLRLFLTEKVVGLCELQTNVWHTNCKNYCYIIYNYKISVFIIASMGAADIYIWRVPKFWIFLKNMFSVMLSCFNCVS